MNIYSCLLIIIVKIYMKRSYEVMFGNLSNNKKKVNKKSKYDNNLNKLLKSLEKNNNHSDSDSDAENENDNNHGVSCQGNRIYFKAEVSDESVEELIKIIDKKNYDLKRIVRKNMLKKVEPMPLYLHITSYGGCLLSGFRAVDAIVRSQIPIYTVVDGYAASAATLISTAGRKRFMTPSSYMLIHQLSTFVTGNMQTISEEFKNCKLYMKDIYNHYIKYSKMTKKEIVEQLQHDYWWKAEKCIEKGLIDEIYGNNNNINNFNDDGDDDDKDDTLIDNLINNLIDNKNIDENKNNSEENNNNNSDSE